MSSQVAWRLVVARRAGAVYVENPKVAAVAVAGSVGAGTADEWSDLELDVYWHAPPTDDDRRRPIERLDGRIEQFWPYSEHEEEWGEEYVLGELGVGISSFLVDSARRFVHRTVVDGDPATLAQIRVATIRTALPLAGHELLAEWKRQTDLYPDVLRRRMVERHLHPDRLEGWHLRDAHAQRRDLLALHAVLVRAQRSVIGALHGLNRVFLANPSMKWQQATLRQFPLAPPDLASRLASAWTADITDRAPIAEALLTDTLDLAERELGQPFPDTRQAIHHRRPHLTHPPPAT